MFFRSEKANYSLIIGSKNCAAYPFLAKTLAYAANPVFQKHKCNKFRQIVGDSGRAAGQSRKDKLRASFKIS